ncbi:hypothetical protein Back2_24130 [Nocardioides baekrokdamisoli]|uniref:Deferrochelatase/peroxidase n=1 Tax=Nocardioides baekrokdamisoli TaxID=1804624 RepID=A0A3G9IIF2_9ACTN|nr:Dyp-type peroxidase [Nocardioides baekrokdamisoli]BBH18126.1 hypothetical protein Back2_24130 [Nocardioides baekrokdamisoli]
MSLSRRGFIASAGAGVALGAAVGAGAQAYADSSEPVDAVDLSTSYDFYTGSHQVGIATPPQRHCIFMTFDLVAGATSKDLQVLLATWSAAIAQLQAGRTVGQMEPISLSAVATDTGEAYGLSTAGLTVTVGLGPGVFDKRLGLAAHRPKLLAPLPALPSESLDPKLTGGDLSVQACADDPQVVYHAIRDLARLGRGVVEVGWTVMGFGRASAGAEQSTPRNLMGYKDGTRNVSTEAQRAEFVWVDDDAAWAAGGTYQVARKIQMDIEIWDSATMQTQHEVFGRTKVAGAPLTGTREFDTPDFHATAGGKPIIDPDSHVALASPENNRGLRILRRGYNFTDGLNEAGQLDAGLLFIAYMNTPEAFIRLQTKMGRSDKLNEYITHVGSGVFFVPPAPKPGHYLAEQLFG